MRVKILSVRIMQKVQKLFRHAKHAASLNYRMSIALPVEVILHELL